MVPGAGIEPARCYHRGILSPLRLPISPPGLIGLKYGGRGRNRTGVHGVAVRCIATLPPGHISKGKVWSGKRDSNSRPQPWQGCALPTELFPQNLEHIIYILFSTSTQFIVIYRFFHSSYQHHSTLSDKKPK